MIMKYTYLVFDRRYRINPDSAEVLAVDDTPEGAKEDQEDNKGSVIVRFEDENNILSNPIIIE